MSQLKNDWKKYTEAVVSAVADYLGLEYNQELTGYYKVKSGDTLFMGNNEYRLNSTSYCTF